jgi:endonuclease YncB( thermonuclease family)
MGRLLGYLFLSDTETLNEQMVAAGHATRERVKP